MATPVNGASNAATIPAVSGENTAGGDGISGTGRRGVVGVSREYQGVFGKSVENAGVVGESDKLHALFGVCHNPDGGGVYGTNDNGGYGVIGVSQSGTGVSGVSHAPDGSHGQAGVVGEFENGVGVFGKSKLSTGVGGMSDSGLGMQGISQTNTGVQGNSPSGRGVAGFSDTWQGVYGHSISQAGVVGESDAFDGVFGISHSADHAGVSGHCDPGTAVSGGSKSGRGVAGFSETWQGVYGHSISQAGVVGESDQFDGVFGATRNLQAAAVSGHNPGGLAGFFDGNVSVTGDLFLPGADCAEHFDVALLDEIEPGTVMVINDAGLLEPSRWAYDRRAAGVVSGAGKFKPGIILDNHRSEDSARLPIALVGKVFCWVDANHAPIQVGDLLTTSDTPGHAMKADDPWKAFGSVIGKALGALNVGRGLIPILIALQ